MVAPEVVIEPALTPEMTDGGGGLFTVTETAGAVVVFPVPSLATALSVCDVLVDVVVFHEML